MKTLKELNKEKIMSYAICQVVYGVPITESLTKVMDDEELENLGFETLYTSSGNYPPGYCGVPIFEFDECEDFAKWSDFTSRIEGLTEDRKSMALDMFKELPLEVKEALKEEGIEGPDIYMVWHSS